MKNLLLIISIALNSCVFIRMDDSVDLGNHFRFIQDYPQAIVYHSTKEYKGVGDIIVAPIVKDYNFNDRYIIAKSQVEEQIKRDTIVHPIQYWIIDKKEKLDLIQPMDSASFYKRFKDLGIELSFKGH